MNREQWECAHEVEKADGGSALPIHPEAFLLDTRLTFEPQELAIIRREWPSISGGTYALIRVNNPLERN